jgi:[ribosomal protein S5]-alanine N-acetyltransferase
MDLRAVVIETERLRLVPMAMEYAELIFREFKDEITRYMYPETPKRIEDTREWITKALGQINRGTDFPVAVLKKTGGEFLGGAGLHRLDTDRPELGIWIKKSAHGNGYGKEAVFGLKAWADGHIGYEYLVYPVERDNPASRRIPEALGGSISREYVTLSEGGREQDLLEYRIYPAGGNTE